MWEDFLAEFVRVLPQFVATISGVFLAFVLDRAVEWFYRRRKRKNLLRELHEELVGIKGLLFPKFKGVHLLYTHIWDSIISSGDIRLLSSDKIFKLNKVYNYIKGTHYEGVWVRRAIEDFNTVPAGERKKKQWLKTRYEDLWKRHFKRGEELSKWIEDLLKEEW